MRVLRDTWYMAAWADDLGPGEILARTLLGTPVALFRRADGSPAAVRDRCPHRFAPLSLGRVHGDRIVCGYHGLGFDGEGACRENPHGPVPRRLSVQAFPLVEACRALWIWMGDPERADPATVPDLAYLADAPDTAFSSGTIRAEAHYEVFVDNLMDLSHTDYLHADTLGGAGVTGTRPEIVETDDAVEATWLAPDTRPSPLMAELAGLPERTDFTLRVRWSPPAVIALTASNAPVGGPASEAAVNRNAHVLTPETDTSAHYFFAATRNYAVDDTALNARLAKERERIFATEDKPMIERIQRNMGDADFWALDPVLLSIDGAPVRVRRRLRKLIDAEQAADGGG